MEEELWSLNGPDRLEDVCLRFLAKNLSLISELGRPRLPNDSDSAGDSVDTCGAATSASGIRNGMDSEFRGSSSADSEITTCHHLRPGIFLPKSICDRFLSILMEEKDEPKEMTFEELSLFSDHEATRLSRVDLRCVADHSLATGLHMLSLQPLTELVMPCVWRCLPVIKKLRHLRSLRLEREPSTNAVDAYIQGHPTSSTENIHSVGSQVDGAPEFSVDAEYYKLTCPSLRRLVLHNLQFRASQLRDLSFNSTVAASLLSPLKQLTHLNLSMCRVHLEELTCLSDLTDLVSLNLSNIRVNDFPTFFKILQPLKKLLHLDLSQGDEDMNPVMYKDADDILKNLVDMLSGLVSLDISGTNLAGFISPEKVSYRLKAQQSEEEKDDQCSIPGLEGRHFEFLGLYNCAYGACNRKHIPATRVTGDADSAQTVLAVKVYIDNHIILIKALNDLFNLFRYATVANHHLALKGVLSAMKAYPKDSSIQIAGSASLFYIAKGEYKQYITYHQKRDVEDKEQGRGVGTALTKLAQEKSLVNLLLSAMYEHCFDQTMMRNACLTLCHLNLPGDVMFCYERLVKQLLDMLKYDYRDEFIHRLGIFLLNCLACQVDGKEKELVGRMGAVETMLQIIARKLRGRDCDDVLEVAWSTLWNVTDETPTNCQKFLNKGGMQLFVQCLQKFNDKPELLRNMMGLMGNIAEVDHLRKHLMSEEYVQIFSDLLDSESDGIEVSYNACGVLSHLCFDGPEVWTLDSLPRPAVMDKMKRAIERWPLHSKRNINYRSFQPILRLVQHYNTPIVQHWSCWALCNLTSVSPEKYCRLLETEKGREVLEQLQQDPRPNAAIRSLVTKTLRQLDTRTPHVSEHSEDESLEEAGEGEGEGAGQEEGERMDEEGEDGEGVVMEEEEWDDMEEEEEMEQQH